MEQNTSISHELIVALSLILANQDATLAVLIDAHSHGHPDIEQRLLQTYKTARESALNNNADLLSNLLYPKKD